MGIGLLYLVSMLMNMFGSGGVGFIHSNGLFGIGFSLFVVAIAALNLVLDFDFIEQGSEMGAPKYMEWFGAFSLCLLYQSEAANDLLCLHIGWRRSIDTQR